MTSSMYEVCRVRVRWLEPGEVALESDLDFEHDFYDGRSIVGWRTPEGWRTAYDADFDREALVQRMTLDKAALLDAIYPGYAHPHTGPSFHIDNNYSPNNPVMEVKCPVTIFEFDAGDAGENWLSYEMGETGAWDVFSKDLVALENIGLWLWTQNQAMDRDRWGVSVCFHAVWLYHVFDYFEGDQDVRKEFCGWLDMRKALATMTSFPPKVERPHRNSTLAHRRPMEIAL